MKALEREATVLGVLRDSGRLGVAELAHRCHCSEPTIRRALARLERAGKIVRTYGGCVTVDRVGFEGIWQERLRERRAEKRRIAGRAAAFVADGSVVILDTGSTVFHVVDFLADRRDLTIVTNFPPILSRLAGRTDWTVIMTGGTVRQGRYDLVGPLAESALREISADVALLGADAVTERGVACDDDEVCRMAGLMVEAASTAVVLADASKFEQRATFRYAAWSEIDWLVTDGVPDSPLAASLGEHGVNVASVLCGHPAGTQDLSKMGPSEAGELGELAPMVPGPVPPP